MPWQGSAPNKSFTRSNGTHSGGTAWAEDEAAGTGITSARHDVHDEDLADAIDAALMKDGGNKMTGLIDAGGFGFTNLATLGSAAEATIASSSTTDLLGSTALFNVISGTTTITSLGTGTNRVKVARFSGALTLTHNATSLILPGGANIVTAAGDVMIVVSDGSSNARVASYQRAASAPASGLPKGYLYGLTLSNNASDATNDIDIAAGEAMDATGFYKMALASSITKRLDASWAVGTGNGGLDTGTIANAWYYLWLIARSDTGVVDVLFSASASSPTMPANYDYKRRIGAVYRTGGALKAFKQVDDRFMWLVPVLDASTTNPGTSAVSKTLTVPVVRVDVDIAVYLVDSSPSLGNFIYVSSPDQTDSVPGPGAIFSVSITGGASTELASGQLRVSTATGAIRYRVYASDADVAVYILTCGWWDSRGKLS